MCPQEDPVTGVDDLESLDVERTVVELCVGRIRVRSGAVVVAVGSSTSSTVVPSMKSDTTTTRARPVPVAVVAATVM